MTEPAPSPRTAPCTGCGILVVYGQRTCARCKTVFNYGPNPPPVPPLAVMQQVYQQQLIAAQAAPAVQAPVPAPNAPTIRAAAVAQPPVAQIKLTPVDSAAASFVDSGRFDDVVAEVSSEQVPGLIDSTLYAAFVPEGVDAPPMEGLDDDRFDAQTAATTVDMPPLETLGIETNEAQAVADVATEQVPGLIDSTLYAAFVPEGVDAPPMEGIERTGGDRRPVRASKAASPMGKLKICPDCGTGCKADLSRCGSCGSPLS